MSRNPADASFPQDAPPAFGRRMAPLDGVRGVAVLMVVVLHYTFWWRDDLSGSAIGRVICHAAHGGKHGVDLFFVISGFLITGILRRSKGGPRYFTNFYARRTLRIFPLYYGVLFAVFVLLPLSPWRNIVGPVAQHQWWLWTYLTNYGIDRYGWTFLNPEPLEVIHFWSLAVEEHFYLFWPLVVFLVSRRGLFAVALGLILFSCAARVQCAIDGSVDGANLLTQCRVGTLAIGALLALYFESGRVFQKRVGIASLLVVLLGTAIVVVWGRRHGHLLSAALKPVVVEVFFAWIIYLSAISGPGTWVYRLLGRGPLVVVGKYSYGLYVYHQLLSHLIYNVTKPHLSHMPPIAGWLLYSLVAGAISLLISFASFHLLEKPFLGLKRLFPAEGSPTLGGRRVPPGATQLSTVTALP